MESSILFWLGGMSCLIILAVGTMLYIVNQRLRREIAFAYNEYRNTFHMQQGMTFKFKKIDGQFIHTFCEGDLAYRLGASPEATIGKALAEFIDDDDYVTVKESYYERAWAGEQVSYEGRLNNVWYIASLSPVSVNGQVSEVIASCVNITQQKLVEHELRESEQMYRLIAESSTDLIRILKTDMTIRYASPSHAEILGYDPEELEGIPCSVLITSDDRERVAQSFNEMIVQKRKHYQLNFCARHKNGSAIMLETHGRLIFDEDGQPAGVVVVSRDLTTRIMEDEENRRREKLTLAGQLAAGIAHEIRNPLTAIKGFTQLLRTPSDRQMFYSDVVATELARVEAIVNEFLLLAKPEAVEFQTHDLCAILTNVVTLLGPQSMLQNVQIHLEPMPGYTPVFAVQSQLKQVFINVIKNAAESMIHGGNVYVGVRIVGDTVVTQIKDEGQGLSEESLSRLGEPFYTTKVGGTGLGLMVSYKIVKDHGGDITVQSSFLEGTSMEIKLPVVKNTATELKTVAGRL